MLEIPARTVFIDPAVRREAACRERLERVLPRLRCDDVRSLDETALDAIRAIGHRRHGKDDFGDDVIVAFTTFEPERPAWYHHFRDGADFLENHGGYCQSAMELNLVQGCAFRCAYCGFGRFIVFALDVERLVDGLDDLFARHPDQRLWKYSNMTDLPAFEPELDAVRPMVERFARETGRWLMLFTKSDNVDFLRDLEHAGQTIVSWSMSSETVSRLIDRRTASMTGRIEAMRRCQEAGYLVRARLSPVVPVKGWRREYRAFFEALFRTCRPDLVTLELLGWFDFDDLARIVPRELIDDAAWRGAETSADAQRGRRWGPFTEATHQEIYRFCIETVRELSPRTPVSVCHGTPATWRALGPLMEMSPHNYLCNCGPTSTPGNPLYDAAV
ncbi:MAG TPA: radical SAM protein [Planctomycetota bacterium]|nr:radical SAM protein [Planctomycetota bacterium]